MDLVGAGGFNLRESMENDRVEWMKLRNMNKDRDGMKTHEQTGRSFFFSSSLVMVYRSVSLFFWRWYWYLTKSRHDFWSYLSVGE